jgi:purine-binding chemotaxis protein CheW
LPGTNLLVDGTVDLKDNIIPATDLRLEFQMEGRLCNTNISIIAVRINASKEPVEIGVVIDKVSEVSSVGHKEIDPPPGMGPPIEKSCFTGKENRKVDVHIMLDIERIMPGEKAPAAPEEETAKNNWRTEYE